MVVYAPAPGGGRKKSPHLSKQDLSSCRTALLKLMQRINFGRIEGLAICDGEPVLHPSPVIFHEIKFRAENGPRPELRIADFLLRKQLVELFNHFDKLQNYVIDVLEIKQGLPFHMTYKEVPA